ncbi:MAG: hypothetical protein ABIG30_02690 [Candidatus Aenigmatarchaeota archaeon]
MEKRKLIEKFCGMRKPMCKEIARRLKSDLDIGLTKIDAIAKENETIIVPGKVLDGNITKPVTIYAYGFSKKASDKLVKASGKAISIEKLIGSEISGRIII